MEIVVLDAATLGKDISLENIKRVGNLTCYDTTKPCEVPERIKDSEIIIVNKVKLDGKSLADAKKLRLICVAATGYDIIDTDWCLEHKIAVCNVAGYSTDSVSQITVSLVLSLWNHLTEYSEFVRSGKYTESGIANRLTPPFYNISGKTWGIIGFGNIGRKVNTIAKSLGCNTLIYSNHVPESEISADLETLCRKSDIISIHLPLNDKTRGLISKDMISVMKKTCVLVNTARGAVTDEEAVTEAIENDRIGAFGSDVYSAEPFPENHPFYRIKDSENVLLTPHIAWASVDSRIRVIDEIIKNIESFNNGGDKSRIV